jgi:hypothetical protein
MVNSPKPEWQRLSINTSPCPPTPGTILYLPPLRTLASAINGLEEGGYGRPVVVTSVLGDRYVNIMTVSHMQDTSLPTCRSLIDIDHDLWQQGPAHQAWRPIKTIVLLANGSSGTPSRPRSVVAPPRRGRYVQAKLYLC